MYGITPNIQKIPASSDKHVHNITQFRGIVDTDNPLIAPDGSAREMENLYIDKDGVLAVRPRLDSVDDVTLPFEGELVKHLISNNTEYFVVLKENNIYEIYSDLTKIYTTFNTTSNTNSTYLDAIITSNNQLLIFINGDILRFNDNIKNPKCESIYNSSFAKTPTVSKGSILGNSLNSDIDNNYEDFNFLTSKYKRTYIYNPSTTDWKNVNYPKGTIDLQQTYSTTQPSITVPENLTIKSILCRNDSYFIVRTTSDSVFCIRKDGTIFEIPEKDPTYTYILKNDYLYIYTVTTNNITLFKKYILTYSEPKSLDFSDENFTIPAIDGINKDAVHISKKGLSINNMFYIASIRKKDTQAHILLYDLSGDGIPNILIKEQLAGYDDTSWPASMDLNLYYDEVLNNIVMLYNSNSGVKGLYYDIDDKITINELSLDGYTAHWDKISNIHDGKIFIWAKGLTTDPYIINYVSNNIKQAEDDVRYIDFNFYNDAELKLTWEVRQDVSNYFIKNITINNALIKSDRQLTIDEKSLWFKDDNDIIVIDLQNKTLYEIIFDVNSIYNIDSAYGYFIDTSKKDTKTSGKLRQFDNKWWMFKDNEVRYTSDLSFNYLPYNNKQTVGGPEPITDILQITDISALLFKEKETYMVTKIEGTEFYNFTSLKTSMGHIPTQQSIMSYVNMPIIINEQGIYTISQTTNVYDSDKIFTSLSDDVAKIYKSFSDKNKIKTHNHEFYTYIYYPEEEITKILVLDSRNLGWYYWEVPIRIDIASEINLIDINYGEPVTELYSGNKKYILLDKSYAEKNQEEHSAKEDIFTYQDRMGPGRFKRIKWKWKSHPMTLNIINNLKKLTRFGLMFADRERELTYVYSDNKYELGTPGELSNLELFYTIKTYRKKSQIFNDSYGDKIEYVASVRLKPRVNKFDYIELELSNYKEDVNGYTYYTYSDAPAENNQGFGVFDKLNLIGLTFETVLSTGV